MKTDIQIQDDIFRELVQDTSFLNSLKSYGFAEPFILTIPRPTNERRNVCVISILANDGAGEVQSAFVNVNVFVNDLSIVDTTVGVEGSSVERYVPDYGVIRPVATLFAERLALVHGDTFRVTLDAQRVLNDEVSHQHFINNKLLYKQLNS